MLVLVLVVAGASATLAVAADRQDKDETRLVGGKPAPIAALADVFARQRQREETLGSPEAREARERSRDAYRDSSPAEAVLVAKQRFPYIMGTGPWKGLNLPDGHRVRRYLDDHAAVVETETGRGGTLVESVLPLRVDDGGEKRPVDLTLEESGSDLVPATPLHRVRIPKRLDGSSVRLAGSGVGIAPADSADVDAINVDSTVFYPNTAADTDFLAKPAPRGVEVMLQLRSQASPESQRLKVALPAGAQLRRVRAPADAIEVVRDGERLATISPPVAFDSDRSPVKLSYAVVGDEIVVEVPHRGKDYAYPIMVDPTLEDDQRYWHQNWGVTREGWNYSDYHDPADQLYPDYGETGAGVYGRGLYAISGLATPGGSFGWFRFHAPGRSWIYRVEFYASHDAYATSLVEGVWNGSSWETGALYDSQGTNLAPWGLSSPYVLANHPVQYLYLTHCLGDRPCSPYNWSGGQAGSAGNQAAIGIYKNAAPNPNWWAQVWAGGAKVFLQDDDRPTTHAGTHTVPPTAWVHDATDVVRPTATDDGLGIKYFNLYVRRAGETWKFVGQQYEPTCGRQPLRCPQSSTATSDYKGTPYRWNTYGSSAPARSQPEFTVDTRSVNIDGAPTQLPEGITYFDIYSYDAVVNMTWGETTWPVRIDRSPPTISTSGSLHDAGDQTIPEGPYSLRVDVTDGTGTGAAARAGVKSVEVKVDGVTQKVVTADSCTALDNCKPEPFTYDFDGAGFAEGEHEVTVVAKDRLWVAGSPTAANHIRTSAPIKFKLRRAAREEIGPGSVNLRTGVFTHSADDVSIDSFASSLTFSRSYSSYRPADRKNGILGPGWTASLPVDEAGSGYAHLTEGLDGRVVVTDADGLEFAFAKVGTTYVAPPGYPGLKLTAGAGPSFTLADVDGNATTFAARAADPLLAGRFVYMPTTITQTAAGVGTTTVIHQTVNGVNRPTRMIAPAPSGVTCTATSLPAGCRSLELVYAASTTATGFSSAQWGDYKDRLRQVRLTAFDPATGAMATDAVAAYSYDANGLLRVVWDPRISPALKTTYDYDGGADGNNRLTAVKPPGQSPWTLAYATIPGDLQNTWRLKSASRSTPQGMATSTVAFGVPISGSGAPYAMGASNVAAWGQSAAAAPATATAIFGPDHVPASPPASASYPKADIHYLDAKAREVNVAAPGGRITTQEYDDHDNATRELTAENRRRVLAGQGAASQLDTRRTFSADGLELRDEVGPLHEVKLESGSVVKARSHTRVAYDEGAPSSAFHLPTTTTVSAQLADNTDHDARVTKQTYDWTIRQPTSVTKDAVTGGLNLKTTTLYNSAGLTTETRQPAGPNGGTAHSTKTIYYTAGSNPDDGECASKPQWANLPCKTRPAAQPGIPGKPDIPTSTYTYNRLNQVVTKTDRTGSSSRTTTTTYDAAGRETAEAIESSAGTPLPAVELDYDDATGALTTTRTTEDGETRSVERAFDSLGRAVSYADADGNTSTTTYDLLGRVVTTNDGKGTQTRTYDPTTGDLAALQDSALGAMTAAYDADGKLTAHTLPNGLNAQTTYDETGAPTHLRYEKTTNCVANCTWFDDQVKSSVHGQWLQETSTLADRDYAYDKVGRLTRVKDTPSGGRCTVRDYVYDADSNRTRSERHSPNLDGSCNTTSTGAITLHIYDSADRLIDPGYEYDDFGRITKVPAGDGASAGVANTYHADDRVHTINTNPASVEQRYALDPLRRVRRETTAGADPGSRTNHFADDSDNPVWTADDTTSTRWTRNIPGIGSDLVATHDSQAGVVIQLPNLHGDVVATATLDSNAPTLLTTARYDEFGAPQVGTLPTRYGWLGAKQRGASQPTGMILMGQRVYAPGVGRFLQVDPVSGGSASSYDYTNQDPMNQTDLAGTYPDALRDANAAELAWCAPPTRWARCRRANHYRRVTARYLARFWGGRDSTWDGERNAFRHCAWSGLMTMAFGSGAAKGFTDRREWRKSGRDTVVDQHNNKTGRNIGGHWQGRRGAQRSLVYDCRRRTAVHRHLGLLLR